jgi:hypothetical protein
MPGFVDVSGMTYEDVRRMGHSDDYDEPRPVYWKRPSGYGVTPAPRVKKLELSTDQVFAAACAAQRINGEYVKATGIKKTNRQITEELLQDPTQITVDDRIQGENMRKYFKGLTFKVIEGKQLSDFSKNVLEIVTNDIITSTYQLAVTVSLPQTYQNASKRDTIDRRINFARGGYAGVVGEKVTLNIEVLKQLWSNNYNTWYLTGITQEDQVVFFAHRNQYDIGTHLTITGTVKSQRETSTQLTRVRVM